MKRKRGRPDYETEKKIRFDILDFIPEGDQGIRWIDIEKKARSNGTSLSTVRKYLELLETGRIIERRVNPDTSPPAVYYIRKDGRYFESAAETITNASPKFWESMRIWNEVFPGNLSLLDNSVGRALKKLDGIRNPTDQKKEQGKLFLYYGTLLLDLLARLFADYSSFASVKESRRFFDVALDTLVRPFLQGMARIANPMLGNCEYVMKHASEVLTEALLTELFEYDETFGDARNIVEKRE